MNAKIVMPLWMAGLFLVIMNTTMFNVSIPGIMADIGISAEAGSWIISGYSVGFALSTLIYSRLSDAVPIRWLLAAGMAILWSASIFGTVAWDFASLLAARIVQSAGSGAMTGLGLVVIRRHIPAEQRGRAIAFISAGSTLAFGVGPIAGGAISALWGWNGLFVVTSLVLIPLLPLIRMLPAEQARPFRFDLPGALLTIANMVSLLILFAQRSVSALAVCIGSFVVHAWHLRRAQAPLIPISMFRIPNYGQLAVIGFCLVFGNLANLFLMPLVLADVFRKTPMEIGLIIAPGALLAALSSRYVGRWIDRRGSMALLLTGHLAAAAILAVFAIGLSASATVILAGYLVFAPANTAMLASLNHETLRIVPSETAGSGMGLMQLIQYAGSSFAVAFAGWMISAQDGLPAEIAYRHIYAMLAAGILVSFGLALGYRMKNRKLSA